MTMIKDQLEALSKRLDLDEFGMAAYLGVTVTTYRHWAAGDRQPGAAVIRLLEVLGTIEALAPVIHDALMPEVE